MTARVLLFLMLMKTRIQIFKKKGKVQDLLDHVGDEKTVAELPESDILGGPHMDRQMTSMRTHIQHVWGAWR